MCSMDVTSETGSAAGGKHASRAREVLSDKLMNRTLMTERSKREGGMV